ncbi:MAG: ABC transporter substrate-binding protein [Leptonema sp. (in: bacteria)]
MNIEKIICLTEEYVELLYLLGEEERIVGISTYVKRPKKAIKEKTIVCSFVKADIDKINLLKPDLILGFSDVQAEIAKDLIKNHHNIFISNQRSINEIFNIMEWVATLLEKKKEYENLLNRWKSKIEHYKNLTQNYDKKKVIFLEWDDPLISGIQWVEEILEILNLKPIFPELKYKKSAKERIVETQEIIKRNPDIILLSLCGKKANLNQIKNLLEQTTAALKNQIYEIDPSIILQPGPALFEEGIDILYHTIYQKFKEA